MPPRGTSWKMAGVTNMVGWSAGCGESYLSGAGSAGRNSTAERQHGRRPSTPYGGDPNPGWLQHHQALAEQFSVYAPSHPGFGHTPGLAWIATIADMALFYLWFLETVGLEQTHLVGHDIGGWLAADLATTCPHVVDRLVLVDAMGLKPQHSEIRDIFLISPAEVRAQSFFDTTQVPEWQQLYGEPLTPEAA